MQIQVSRFPLQRLMRALPKPLRRIKLAQLLAALAGSPYHRVAFQQGELVGNVRDREVANTLVRGIFANYGYFELARRLLSAGDVHVDVGTNYGFHTFGLLPLAIGSTVRHVLVEANPDCVACLRESVKLHPAAQLQVYHRAVAATAGDLPFTFAPAVTGGGRVGQVGTSDGIEITVAASTLDQLFEESGLDRVRLLKMDIEGSELRALQGLAGVLSAQGIDFIYFEVNPTCLEAQQADPQACFAELSRHGYRLFWPHDSVDWVLQTCGLENLEASGLKHFTIFGSQPHRVIGFDQSCYRKGRFGQCDLLAVSPRCRVEPA